MTTTIVPWSTEQDRIDCIRRECDHIEKIKDEDLPATLDHLANVIRYNIDGGHKIQVSDEYFSAQMMRLAASRLREAHE